MKTLFTSAVLLLASLTAHGAVVWQQWPGSPPGDMLPSQFWYDPTQQNNLDSDAAAYDGFTLTKATTITHVEWWGDGAASIGFFIEFYNQDTNTIAYQPDLTQFYGHQPLASETVTNDTVTGIGNGLYHYSAALAAPVTLAANTTQMPRYFFSVVDSMPTAYATWGWAQGTNGDGATFYYQLAGSPAGGPYYTLRHSDRAFLLADDSPVVTLTGTRTNTVVISWPADSTGFKLQQNSTPTATNWVPATNAVSVAGGLNQVVVPVAEGKCFFRLYRP